LRRREERKINRRENKRGQNKKREKIKEKTREGYYGHFNFLHSQEKLFCQMFLQNGFNSPAESAPPAQPQPEPPQSEPEPCQKQPKIVNAQNSIQCIGTPTHSLYSFTQAGWPRAPKISSNIFLGCFFQKKHIWINHTKDLKCNHL
jgi:hypothetical protein